MRLTHRDEYCRWCSDGSKASLQLGYEDYPSILRGDAVDKLAAYEDTGLSPEEFKEKSESVLELYGKLKPYADAEDQGRLVVLPCKVGDVIWWNNGHRIIDCHVIEIQISEGRSEVIFRFGTQLNLKAGARFEDFGKTTVFLTQEEAEAALKGGQDNANN